MTFNSPGGPYTFTVPAGVTSLNVEAIGGAGGNWNTALPYTRGADVSATLAVTPGQTLYVYVGGNGGGALPNAGGVNGGGTGGGSGYGTGGGGGASDIRTVSGDLTSRILVAGGGGGSNVNSAGGDAGQDGTTTYGTVATAGGATAGGLGGVFSSTYPSYSGTDGTFGQGGTGGADGGGRYGGGGGGGWYGGGGGDNWGGGAGGSSYVITTATNVTNALSSLPPVPAVTITYVSPAVPPVLANAVRLGNGNFQFSFTNVPGASFTVLTSTNLSLSLTNWTPIGSPVENPAGHYQFTDSVATNNPVRFYRVESP